MAFNFDLLVHLIPNKIVYPNINIATLLQLSSPYSLTLTCPSPIGSMHLIPLYISSIVYLHILFNSLHRILSCLIDLLNMIFFEFSVVHAFLIFAHIIPINFNYAPKNVSFLATLLTIRAIVVSMFLRVVSISLITWYLMNTHSLFKISLIHNHHLTFT